MEMQRAITLEHSPIVVGWQIRLQCQNQHQWQFILLTAPRVALADNYQFTLNAVKKWRRSVFSLSLLPEEYPNAASD